MKSGARIIVKGLVQGVGYRYFCYKKAAEYNISGYAENLDNGDVRLEIEGEKGMINDFIKNLKTGPRSAQVKTVNIDEMPYEGKFTSFQMY